MNLNRRTVLATISLGLLVGGLLAPFVKAEAANGPALPVAPSDCVSAWADASGVTHVVTTTRKGVESATNLVWRHAQRVDAALSKWTPAGPPDMPPWKNGSIVSEWVSGGITHRVVTPVDPDVPIGKILDAHDAVLNAMKAKYPPGASSPEWSFFAAGGHPVPLDVLVKYGARAILHRAA